MREARLYCQFPEHENIVKCVDLFFGKSDNTHFYLVL